MVLPSPRLPYLLILLAFSVLHAGSSADGADSSSQEQPYREVPVLNAGLGKDPGVTLDTPQSLMETFLGAFRRGDHGSGRRIA